MKYVIGAGVSLLLAAITFLFADCSAGRTGRFSAEVTGKHCKPQWTEVIYETKLIGEIRYTVPMTVHHPEEWHVYIRELEGDWTGDIQVTAGNYHVMTNGHIVWVSARYGRWTQNRYMASITAIEQ